jgi:transposase
MIAPAAGVRILIATQPVDFRKGGDGLAAIAQHVLGEDPFSGTVIVFRARRSDRVKLLVWDGTGLVLIWKRLERGVFKWPAVRDETIRLSAAQLAILLEGLDWSHLAAPPAIRPRLAQ